MRSDAADPSPLSDPAGGVGAGGAATVPPLGVVIVVAVPPSDVGTFSDPAVPVGAGPLVVVPCSAAEIEPVPDGFCGGLGADGGGAGGAGGGGGAGGTSTTAPPSTALSIYAAGGGACCTGTGVTGVTCTGPCSFVSPRAML